MKESPMGYNIITVPITTGLTFAGVPISSAMPAIVTSALTLSSRTLSCSLTQARFWLPGGARALEP